MVKTGESLTDRIKKSEEKDGFASGPVAPVGASLGGDGVANTAYELMGGGNSKTSVQAASASSESDKQNLVKTQELINQQEASAEHASGKKKEDFASIGNVGGTVSTLALPASTSLGFSLIGGKRKTRRKNKKGKKVKKSKRTRKTRKRRKTMKKRQKNKKKKKKPKRKTKGRKTKGKKQTRKKSKVGYGEDPKYIEENKVNFTVKELTFYLDLLEKGNPTSLRGTKIINFYLKNKDSFKNVKDSNGKSFPFRSV
tara:strand:- start:58 stop:822 length:765 start_codon:yes stop_codon:yes gene_type:complete